MKFIQLTNSSIGAVTASTAMPLGVRTQSCMNGGCNQPTFTTGTTGANYAQINETGRYRATYTAYVEAGTAGNDTFTMTVNGDTADSATVTTTADGYSTVVLDYIFRVCKNCSSIETNFPAVIQITNGTVALTGGNSNLIIERIGD